MIYDYTPIPAITLSEEAEDAINATGSLAKFNAGFKKLHNTANDVAEFISMSTAINAAYEHIDYRVINAAAHDAFVRDIPGMKLLASSFSECANVDGIGIVTVCIDNLRKEYKDNELSYAALYSLTANSVLARMMASGILFIDPYESTITWGGRKYDYAEVELMNESKFKTPWDLTANLITVGCLFGEFGYMPSDDDALLCTEYVRSEWEAVSKCTDEDGCITEPCFSWDVGTPVPFIKEFVESIFACDLELLLNDTGD